METAVPSGAADGNRGKVFILTVNTDGIAQRELGRVNTDGTLLTQQFTGDTSDEMAESFTAWMKDTLLPEEP